MQLPTFIVESKLTPYIAVGASALCIVQLVLSLKAIFVVDKKKVVDVPKKCLTAEGYKEKLTAYVFNGETRSISGSPFTTKLLAYLRFAGIPHNVKEAQFEKAPKNKVPYIAHAGSFFGDSQLIIRYLANTFDVAKMSVAAVKDLNGLSKAFVPFDSLSPTDQALSDSIRLTCEGEMYWALCNCRWGGDIGLGNNEALWYTTRDTYFGKIPAFIRYLLTPMIRVQILKDAWGYGLIRHSPEDQMYLASRAVRSLSNLLGKKAFFLGDFPSECDCSALGALECVLDDSRWPNPLTDFIRKECPNLEAYVTRVRQIVFSDVDPSAVRPGSKEGVTPIAKGK
jgi:glutathione S-transferase